MDITSFFANSSTQFETVASSSQIENLSNVRDIENIGNIGDTRDITNNDTAISFNALEELNRNTGDVNEEFNLRAKLYETKDAFYETQTIDQTSDSAIIELKNVIKKGQDMLKNEILKYSVLKEKMEEGKNLHQNFHDEIIKIKRSLLVLREMAINTDCYKDEIDKFNLNIEKFEQQTKDKMSNALKETVDNYNESFNRLLQLKDVYKILKHSDITFTCPICIERQVDLFLIPCGHTICIIILLSTLASSLRPETFVDINTLSDQFSKLAVGALGSNPNNANNINSKVVLIPSEDDLLRSGIMKSNLTKGLPGKDSISTRSCSDNSGDGQGLMSSVDSNKNGCGIIIDDQAYNLTSSSTTLNMHYTHYKRNSNFLPIEVDDSGNLIKFLLSRPVVFTINNSAPYVINWSTVPFLFNTNSLIEPSNGWKVKQYEKNNKIFNLPISKMPLNNGGSNFFPNLTKELHNVIDQKFNTIKEKIRIDPKNIVMPLNIVCYYTKRDEHLGNSWKLQNNMTKTCLSIDQDSTYIQSKFKNIKAQGASKNTTISVVFKVKLTTTTGINTDPLFATNQLVLNITGKDKTGERNIINIQTLPVGQRQSRAGGYEEIKTKKMNFNNKYACLLFSNAEKNTSNNSISSSLSTASYMWIPVNVLVDIAYITSPTMKVIVATYYDPKTNKRHTLFDHKYSSGPVINDIHEQIKISEQLCLNTNATRKDIVDVPSAEVSFGMVDLQQWFYSPS